MDLEHEPEHGSASSLDAALQTQDRKNQENKLADKL
jgi:hypothetical protein